MKVILLKDVAKVAHEVKRGLWYSRKYDSGFYRYFSVPGTVRND